MGGSSAFLRLGSMPCFLHQGLEFLARVESDNAPRADRDLFAGLGIAAGTLRLIAQLEVAEAGELDRLPPLERAADLLEERFHHVLRFALVEADLLEKEVGQLGLRQRHLELPRSPLFAQTCREFSGQQADQGISGSVRLRIREGPFSILHNYPERNAFSSRRHARTLV